MKDPDFIYNRIKRGQEALERFEREFSLLTKTQLNWKHDAQSWSVAECMQHLIIADSYYFEDLHQIGSGTYRMTFWEKHSPLAGVFGKLLNDQMKEQVKIKMTTHAKLTPVSSEYELAILDTYRKNLTKFMHLTEGCRDVDLDKTIINSPTITWITYSLRDALEFLLEHEHRHLNQAIRIKGMMDFEM